MKKIALCLFAFLTGLTSFAQNNAGISTTTPNASALLDISSTSKGLLIPRMTSAQRNAITSPAKSLMVFDTDTNSFWYYNGNAWTTLAASASLTLPLQQSVNYGGYAFDISNLGAGGALKGVSNTASGIGVYGETSNGNGVKGYANNAGSIGVFGSSLAGTGVKATSFTGIALDVIGNVKISGGNTNPTAGAVLTSDAAGNAVWKSMKVGFIVSGQSQSVPYNSFANLTFDNITYDAGSNFNSSSASSNPNSFKAPASGLYHFSAAATLQITSSVTNIFSGTITLSKCSSSGSGFAAGVSNRSIDAATFSNADVQVDGDAHLFAGERVTVQAWATNNGSLPTSVSGKRFSGHLVYAD